MIFLEKTKCTSQIMKVISKNVGKRMEFIEVERIGMDGGLTTL